MVMHTFDLVSLSLSWRGVRGLCILLILLAPLSPGEECEGNAYFSHLVSLSLLERRARVMHTFDLVSLSLSWRGV